MLRRYTSNGYGLHVRLISLGASVRCCQRERRDGSDQCGNSAKFGRHRCAFRAVLDGFSVRDEVLIEHDDFTRDLKLRNEYLFVLLLVVIYIFSFL